jgi:uncharacterized protein YbjT (DUF2867 family)
MPPLTNGKTALLFGYTGLIGGILAELLLNDDRYSEVKVFVRGNIEKTHPKLKIIINPLHDPNEISDEIMGDELFCCLGTTMKKAGSKAKFEKVDFELPVEIARIASQNGVNKFLVVSSIGANSHAKGFYLKTKGRMEEKIKSFPFGQVVIMRPSLLLGQREEKRMGEEIGKILAGITSFLFKGRLRKFKPIHAENVAKAMLYMANTHSAKRVFESDVIEELSRQQQLISIPA